MKKIGSAMLLIGLLAVSVRAEDAKGVPADCGVVASTCHYIHVTLMDHKWHISEYHGGNSNSETQYVWDVVGDDPNDGYTLEMKEVDPGTHVKTSIGSILDLTSCDKPANPLKCNKKKTNSPESLPKCVAYSLVLHHPGNLDDGAVIDPFIHSGASLNGKFTDDDDCK